MKVTSLQFKICDAKIGLPEFLNISDARLQEIGIQFPFQRKRILFGLLKFHRYKFRKDLMLIMPPPTADHPWQIQEYFNTLSKCLKYLIVVKSALAFVERDDIFEGKREENGEIKELVHNIEEFVKEIERQATVMLKQFKYVSSVYFSNALNLLRRAFESID